MSDTKEEVEREEEAANERRKKLDAERHEEFSNEWNELFREHWGDWKDYEKPWHYGFGNKFWTGDHISPETKEIVFPVWKNGILPELWRNAQKTSCTAQDFFRQLSDAKHLLLEELYLTLHDNIYSRRLSKEEKPEIYWWHQDINILEQNIFDKKRKISIYNDGLLEAAANYLSKPEIRTDTFDWIFLDSIVFAELDGTMFRFKNRLPLSILFSGYANKNGVGWKGYWTTIAIRLFRHSIAPSIAIIAMIFGPKIIGLSILGLWILAFIEFFLNSKKNKNLLMRLLDVYRVLGNHVISPQLLKELLYKATEEGVVIDGAVFSIVDRMILKGTTALIPSRKNMGNWHYYHVLH